MSNKEHRRVLLADYQYLTRKALASLIEETSGFAIIGMNSDVELLEEDIQRKQPDLLVLELEGYDSASELLELTKRYSEMPVLYMLPEPHSETIKQLLSAGAKGIICKRCDEYEIVNALNTVSANNRYYCSTILDQVMDMQSTQEQETPASILTDRELEILRLIAKGNTTQQIAEKLHISVHTVNSHRKNILKKLNLNSPIQLVAYAMEAGLVTK